MARALVLLVAAAALCACSAPQVRVHEPTSVRPPAAVPPPARADGAIYRAESFRPLFEDRRARHVGDTLTIVINEKISAAQQNATSVRRSGAVKAEAPAFDVPAFRGIAGVRSIPGRIAGTDLELSSSIKHDAKGAASASNTFSGTITVTVIEVLANGNLLVAGEKEIGTNREVERLRFSGVVNPATIGPGNQVSSTQVADARLEYRGEGALDSAQVMGWLSRFFLSFLPF